MSNTTGTNYGVILCKSGKKIYFDDHDFTNTENGYFLEIERLTISGEDKDIFVETYISPNHEDIVHTVKGIKVPIEDIIDVQIHEGDVYSIFKEEETLKIVKFEGIAEIKKEVLQENERPVNPEIHGSGD